MIGHNRPLFSFEGSGFFMAGASLRTDHGDYASLRNFFQNLVK